MLTESRLLALEKTMADKDAHREVDREHPDGGLTQDTFYVRHPEGRGPSLPAEGHRLNRSAFGGEFMGSLDAGTRIGLCRTLLPGSFTPQTRLDQKYARTCSP